MIPTNGSRYTRRDFLSSAAAGSAISLLQASLHAQATQPAEPTSQATTQPATQPTTQPASQPASQPATQPVTENLLPPPLPDLTPARWLWYPSGRTLPNTFVLFRRELSFTAAPRRATGWIMADSRYQLLVNGQRVQFGPAPCDPRYSEADPIDLTPLLHAGRNVLGAQVLYYGFGDGTWPIGKPGFLFWLEIEHADGHIEKLLSDRQWLCLLPRSWQAGHYRRWYLRALQEEFDARLYPYGWATENFTTDANWLAAMELNGSPNKPALCTEYPDYLNEVSADPNLCVMTGRQVPLMSESHLPIARLSESMWLRWKRPIEEYFAVAAPDAFETDRTPCATQVAPDIWTVSFNQANPSIGAALTFEFAEQGVGWPQFTIEAPAGTIVELLVHEAHEVGAPPLLNSHFHAWTRFICREGVNSFETFDFESLRWLQLHIHQTLGPVTIRNVGMRRRVFPWPSQPLVRIDEPPLQRLMGACINTLNNCAQETCVDGMARERQQYSGDVAHQINAILYACNERRLPARFIRTFSQGITASGFFLDCWPAYDRLSRVMCREVGMAGWGPILDHGIGFVFDCLKLYLHTGSLDVVKEAYPRLIRFARYLVGLADHDTGLLPVENLGVPCVWLDHQGFQRQAHKQCAFNLYAAAMLEHGLAHLARAFNDPDTIRFAREKSREILTATVRRYWSPDLNLFVDNLPFLGEEQTIRLHDRTLATCVSFDQCPAATPAPAIKMLVDCPPNMGRSYPANACWRMWALAKAGRSDVIIRDFREKWATMDSVRLNNTIAEDWVATPDSGAQWSHCAVVPLYGLYMSIAGIRPLDPGFTRCEIRPQLGDLKGLELVAHTIHGPIQLRSQVAEGNRALTIAVPSNCTGELVLPDKVTITLPVVSGATNPAGHRRYRLDPGKSVTVQIPVTTQPT